MSTTTQTALQAAVAHFKARRHQKLEVPELGLTVHFSMLSLKERLTLVPSTKNGAEVSLALARLVALKALDETGAPVFGPETTELLHVLQHEVDPVVLNRIANAILDHPSEVEAEKN